MLARLAWRLPLVVFLALAAVGPAQLLASHALDAFAAHARQARLLWGAALLGAAGAWVIRRRLPWLAVFVHEQAHAAAALLLLRPVTGLRVTAREGGHVTYRGEPSLWIAAAPYCVPLAALAGAMTSILMRGASRPPAAVVLAIGAALGVHGALAVADLLLNARDVRAGGRANDFAAFGRPVTLLYIFAVNAALLGSLVAFATGGAAGVAAFWRQAVEHDLLLARRMAGG